MIELLEQRIAPAVVTINAGLRTASWIDADGDSVTMKWSSAVPPTFITENSGLGLLVDRLVLTPANHTNAFVTISVSAAVGGDGRVEFGRVDATGTPLSSWVAPLVNVAEFDVGNGTRAINTLVMGSLGSIPNTSFTNNAGDGDSNFNGLSGILSIRGNVDSASLTTGAFKSLSILGSVRGDSAGGAATPGLLTLNTNGKGAVLITGSIIGGDAPNEGHVNVTSHLASFVVRGSIIGGSAAFTGAVDIGGTGTISAVSVLGSIIGGSAPDSGVLSVAQTDTLVAMNIAGNMVGGTAERTGVVSSGPLTTFTLGGSLFGGTEQNTGDINLKRAGTVTLKGSIFGGRETSATANGFIATLNVAENLRTLSINGDIVSGTFGSGSQVGYNGAVLVGKNLTTATIKGSLVGNAENKAMILAGGAPVFVNGDYNAIGRLTILGSVSQGYIAAGHTADITSFAARIGNAENPDAGIGPVLVGGDWFHSSLGAGFNDGGDFGISTADTHSAGDPAKFSKLVSVIIKGRALDNPTLTDVSGIAANKILNLTVGGVGIFSTGSPNRNLDPFGRVDVFEG